MLHNSFKRNLEHFKKEFLTHDIQDGILVKEAPFMIW